MYLSSQFILLNATEVGILIKVNVCKLSSLQHFGCDFTSAVHNRSEHLVVGTAGEENFASI